MSFQCCRWTCQGAPEPEQQTPLGHDSPWGLLGLLRSRARPIWTWKGPMACQSVGILHNYYTVRSDRNTSCQGSRNIDKSSRARCGEACRISTRCLDEVTTSESHVLAQRGCGCMMVGLRPSPSQFLLVWHRGDEAHRFTGSVLTAKCMQHVD